MIKKNNSKIRILLLLSSLLLCQSVVMATEYFVSSANEIKSAMNIAQPGDTLTMTKGLWNDERIILQGNGTEDQPILLRAEEPGYVILNGTSTLRIAGAHLVVDGLYFVGGYSRSGGVIEFRNGSSYQAKHSRLTNSAIIDYNPSSRSDDYKWVSLYGEHNRVDHCYFEGKNHSGTTLVVWLSGQPNYHTIDYNYFAHRPPLGTNGGETIRVGTSDWSMYDSYTLIENNYFEHCNGETEIISNKSCKNTYRHNTFYECEGTLTLRHGNEATVEQNIFYGNKKSDTGGVRVIGEDHKIYNNYFYGLEGSGYRAALPIMNGVPNSPLNRYFQVKRAEIAFNTFVDCRYTFILGSGSDSEKSLPPQDCVIANNLVSTTQNIIKVEDEPINLMWEGNVMQGSSLGIPVPDGIQLTDPMMSLATDGFWRPDSLSPVIDNAVGDYPYVIQDMDGQSRDALKDIGADEFNSGPVVISPVTSWNTGPSWLSNELPLVLTLQKSGSGEVQAEPGGSVYDAGTEIMLTAVPEQGWKFMQWDGDLEATDNPVVFNIQNNMTVRAVFAIDGPEEYTLSVFVFSSGGHVELDPPGGTYPESTMVTLTAIPDSGYVFDMWQGDLSGSSNPDSILMLSDKMVLGVFSQATGIDDVTRLPLAFELKQNYPNPFNAGTTISFSLHKKMHTELTVYDMIGRKVAMLINESMEPGQYRVHFDAEGLPSAIYTYELRSGHAVIRKKMAYMK